MDIVESGVLVNVEWDYNDLSYNKNIKLASVIKNPFRRWNWDITAGHPTGRPTGRPAGTNLVVGDNAEALSNPIYPWDWENLSCNEHISIDTIRAYAVCWNWSSISSRRPIEEIIKNLDLPWKKDALSYNESLTEAFIRDYGHLIKNGSWQCDGLLANDAICPEFVLELFGDQFDWTEASKHVCDFKFIEKHIKQKWDWPRLAKNPCLTEEFILKHINELGRKNIARNEFLWDDRMYAIEIVRDIAARRNAQCELLSEFVQPREFAAIVTHYVDYC